MSIVINSFYHCDKCKKKEAEIFQTVGNYCLDCWDEITHPDIS